MKTSKKLLPSIIIALVFPQLGWSQGSMIWSHTFSVTNDGTAHIFNQANFWLDYEHTNPPAGYFEPLFNQISFGTNDVGRTFTIASIADDPDFATVVSALTNGIDQSMVFFLGNFSTNGAGILYGYPESQLFTGVGTGPDLTGYQIQSFGLHVDSLSFQTPGSNPNGDGNWTDYSEQVTLSINGYAVPEPSSAALVLLGGGVLLYVRECKRFRR